MVCDTGVMARCVPLVVSYAASAVVLGLALSACGRVVHVDGAAPGGSGGGSTPSAAASGSGDAASYAATPVAQIEDDVQSALKAASSLHMAGSIIESGQQMDFDVSVDTAGDCTGTMGLHDTTVRLLGVKGDYYFKAPRAFWKAEEPAELDQVWSLVGGKWVKIGASDQMADLCDLTQFTKGLFDDDGPDKGTKVVGPSQFAGQPTVELKGTSDDGSATEIQVLASSPHYPVRLDAGSQGEMTFSDFDTPVRVTAPDAAQTVDVKGLS